jgi:DNA methylase
MLLDARDALRPLPAPGAPAGNFMAGVRAFAALGRPTEAFEDAGIPYLVNAFWTAGQRRAHAIHEVSYRACFKPQLPEFFIARLTAPGEAVHDPFMGRGTTPIQAALMRRRPLGSDINPLSILLTRPRLRPPGIAAIAARLTQIPWHEGAPGRDDLLAFYHPATLRQLAALRTWLAARAPLDDPAPDPVDDWIRMVALNRLSGHSPGFFSVRTMPPNQAVSVASQLRMNAKAGTVPPPRDVARLILKKSAGLLADGTPPPHPPGLLLAGPATASPAIADASVALVVTSPPFLDVVQYAEDNWLRCWFAGIDPAAVPIALHRTESGWATMVRDVLAEQARLLRPGGHVAFEVGEVRRGALLLERLVWQAAADLPFARLGVLVNRQDFTKTAQCWGIANNRGGTNTNRIVVLRRR